MKRKLQYLGIQMAQGLISNEDAQGLGVISYLNYIKYKAECLYSSVVFGDKFHKQFPDRPNAAMMSELSISINNFIQLLRSELISSNSVETFTEIDHYLRFHVSVKDDSVASTLSELLDEINNKAINYLGEPGSSFSDRIISLQYLAAVHNSERSLNLEAKDFIEVKSVLAALDCLTLHSQEFQKSNSNQSIPESQSVLYKSAV